jgi:putative transposase
MDATLMQNGHFSWVPELEWKHDKLLDKQATSMQNRYQRDEHRKWQCPPGEAYAKPLGLYYHVRTSAEYHAHYIENMKFLQDYWAHPNTVQIRVTHQ